LSIGLIFDHQTTRWANRLISYHQKTGHRNQEIGGNKKRNLSR